MTEFDHNLCGSSKTDNEPDFHFSKYKPDNIHNVNATDHVNRECSSSPPLIRQSYLRFGFLSFLKTQSLLYFALHLSALIADSPVPVRVHPASKDYSTLPEEIGPVPLTIIDGNCCWV
jgi:hypothetical protein